MSITTYSCRVGGAILKCLFKVLHHDPCKSLDLIMHDMTTYIVHIGNGVPKPCLDMIKIDMKVGPRRFGEDPSFLGVTWMGVWGAKIATLYGV